MKPQQCIYCIYTEIRTQERSVILRKYVTLPKRKVITDLKKKTVLNIFFIFFEVRTFSQLHHSVSKRFLQEEEKRASAI